jgi:pyruvate dehydrogenase phosphatase
MGDARYKWTKEIMEKIQTGFAENPDNSTASRALRRRLTMPEYSITPPYVTARPEVLHHNVDEKDAFVIIASDGLWDRIENEEAVEVVGEWLEKNKRSGGMTDQNAATALLHYALSRAPTAQGHVPDLASRLLSLPPGVSRNYRDDITVSVLFLPTETGAAVHNSNSPVKIMPMVPISASSTMKRWPDEADRLTQEKAKL